METITTNVWPVEDLNRVTIEGTFSLRWQAGGFTYRAMALLNDETGETSVKVEIWEHCPPYGFAGIAYLPSDVEIGSPDLAAELLALPAYGVDDVTFVAR